MRSRLVKHLNPATVIALLALVFAMTGGAYAVSNGGHGDTTNGANASVAGGAGAGSTHPTATGSAASVHAVAAKKTKKPAGKPGPRGPQGPAGPAGAQGPAGPAGPQGPAGPKGENGTNGTNGQNGSDGVSVTSKTLKKGEGGCPEGGTELIAADGKKTTACNGKTGSPWAAGGTLPAGSSEKGEWSVTLTENYESTVEGYGSISFGVPLASAPATVYVTETEKSHAPECPGTAEEPEAAEGDLCIYAAPQTEHFATFTLGTFGEAEAGKDGAYIVFSAGEISGKPDKGHVMHGTWAVTG